MITFILCQGIAQSFEAGLESARAERRDRQLLEEARAQAMAHQEAASRANVIEGECRHIDEPKALPSPEQE